MRLFAHQNSEDELFFSMFVRRFVQINLSKAVSGLTAHLCLSVNINTPIKFEKRFYMLKSKCFFYFLEERSSLNANFEFR